MTLRERWKKTSLPNKLLIIVGCFSALMASLSVAVSYWQYKLAEQSDISTTIQVNRLIAAMNTANSNQLLAIEKALESSKASITATTTTAADDLNFQREAMRLERRAWVGALGIPTPTVQAGTPIRFQVQIRNSGSTPAKIQSARMQTRTFGINQPFVARYDELKTPPSRLVLQPDMTVGFTRVGPIPLTPELITAITTAPTQRIYVFGEIEYTDIFERRHRTIFCQWLDTDRTFKWCDTYNEAD
jgi:hypothetical protein